MLIKFKKSICLLVVLLLVVTSFAGCSEKGTTSPSSGTNVASGSAESGAGNSAPPRPVDAPPALPLADGAQLTVATMENNYPPASFAENLAVYQEFEKLTGVKVNWEVYPQNDYDSIMATRLASGTDLPDIFVIPWEMEADKIGMDGMAIPLNDLLPANAYYLNRLMESNPDVRRGITAGDGNIYAYPGFGEGLLTSANDMETGNFEDPGANITLFTTGIRKDWLDKLGLDEPKTLDDWYNVLKAFKTRDPNGNGQADEIPIMPTFNYQDIFLFGSATGLYKKDRYNDYWSVDTDGSLFFMPTDARFKELLVFFNKLYSEGLLDPEFAGARYPSTVEKINMNLVGALFGNWNSNYASYNSNLVAAGVENPNWISIKPPADPQGRQKIYNRWSIWKTTAISKSCKNPELAVQWLDFHCLSPQGVVLQNFGVEGLTYEKGSDGSLNFTDFVMKNPDGLGVYEALRSIGAWAQVSYIQTKEANLAVNVSNPTQVEFAASFAAEDVMKPLPDSFPYTTDEMTTFTETFTTLRTMMDENNIAFITGTRSLDDFDKYVNEMNSAGLEKLIEITQSAYARYLAS